MRNVNPAGSFRRQLQLITITSLLIYLPSISHADSYLNELEAEASSMNGPPQTQEEEKNDWSYRDQSLTERLPADLTRLQFEQQLREDSLALFLFYEKLTPAQKQGVYESYQQDNSVANIRDAITSGISR